MHDMVPADAQADGRGMDRRRFLLGAAGVAGLFGLAACGSDPAPTDATGTSASGRSTGRSTGPYTVQHKYGTTKIAKPPSRVVTVGYTDQEPVLALGVVPVGVVDFFGERPYGKWPWERSLYRDSAPTIIGERDEYEFEKIAALRPDLIVGVYSGMTKQNYGTLSEIAPTVAQPLGYADFTAPWTVQTKFMGQALGRQPRADDLVAGIRAQFAKARTAHPEFKNKTIAVAEPFKANEWAVFGAGDPKIQFFKDLGFSVAPSVTKLEPGGDVATISTERLDLLDVDRLVLLIDNGDQTEAQVRANPLFSTLAVAREKRTTFFPFSPTPPVGAALAFNSVLSIPYALERAVPAVAAAG